MHIKNWQYHLRGQIFLRCYDSGHLGNQGSIFIAYISSKNSQKLIQIMEHYRILSDTQISLHPTLAEVSRWNFSVFQYKKGNNFQYKRVKIKGEQCSGYHYLVTKKKLEIQWDHRSEFQKKKTLKKGSSINFPHLDMCLHLSALFQLCIAPHQSSSRHRHIQTPLTQFLRLRETETHFVSLQNTTA